MEAEQRSIQLFASADGTCPYEQWFMALNDITGQAKIAARVARASQGNFGVHESVGDGVCELKIDFGPGYRVYYGIDGDDIVLLGGGNKDSQSSDIKRAKVRWKEYGTGNA